MSIEKIFDYDAGTIGFLRKTINQKKAFHSENVKIFEFYLDIIKDHAKQMEPYTVNIFNVTQTISNLVPMKIVVYLDDPTNEWFDLIIFTTDLPQVPTLAGYKRTRTRESSDGDASIDIK